MPDRRHARGLFRWSGACRPRGAGASWLWISTFGLYLSLFVVGQTFLSFQWDILLLEAGFLCAWLCPLLRPTSRDPPSVVAVWLLRFVLFKLMLMSGVVKIQANCPTWLNLTGAGFPLGYSAAPDAGGVVRCEIHHPRLETCGRRGDPGARGTGDAPPRVAVSSLQARGSMGTGRPPGGHRGDGQLLLLQPPDHRPRLCVLRRRGAAAVLGGVGRRANGL